MNTRPGRKPFRWAALAFAFIVAASILTFTRGVPVRSSFEVRGIFKTANQLRRGSEVRMAGIPIGTVRGIDAGPGNTSVVTMKITNRDLPIRVDAHLAIEPRLALEGNYYVQVSPGSPDGPRLTSGGTVPLSNTTGPVQIDQVLDTFTHSTRTALTATIGTLRQSLASSPEGTGSDALRTAARELDRSLGNATKVAHALRGTRSGDLGAAVRSTGDLAHGISTSPQALAGLITSYNRVFAALATSEGSLAASVSGADELLRRAPPALGDIDSALPPLTRFARALRPALAVAPPTLRSANRALAQLVPLFGPAELPRILRPLSDVTANLPRLERRLGALFPFVDTASSCISRNVVGTLDATVPDGAHSTGQPVWLEGLHMAAGFAGLAEGFDGNGSNLRLGVSEDLQRAIALNVPGSGQLVGLGQIDGVAPTWLGPGVSPPNRPDARCDTQNLPNLGLRRSEGMPSAFRRLTLPAQSRAASKLLAALIGRNKSQLTSALLQLLPRALRPTVTKHAQGKTAGAKRKPPLNIAVSVPHKSPSVPPKAVPTPSVVTQVKNGLSGILTAVGGLLHQKGRR